MVEVLTSIRNVVGDAIFLDTNGEDALVTETGQAISTGFSGIHATANNHDITVLGTVWGNLAGIRGGVDTAITATDIFVGESGFVGSAAYAIDTENAYTYVTNNGDIMGEGGIRHDGILLNLTNYGLIASGTSSALRLEAGTRLDLTNHGDISINSASQTAIRMTSGGDSSIYNHGTISAGGYAVSIETTGANALFNTGTIEGGIYLWSTNNSNQVTFENSGSVIGGGVSVGSAATLENSGYIQEYVILGSDDDLFVNTGHIGRYVNLYRGDDTFVVRDGTVDGVVNGNIGVDMLDLTEFGAGIWADLGTSTAWDGEIWTRDDNGIDTGLWRHLYDTLSFENVRLTAYTDYIFGSDQDNIFTATEFVPEVSGIDRLHGRGGDDIVDYGDLGFGLWINLHDTAGSVWTKMIEDVTADGDWTQLATMTGVEGAFGSIGIDDVVGSTGDDFFGYRGSYTVHGVEMLAMGAGSDTVSFEDFGYAVWVSLGEVSQPEAWTRDSFDVVSGTWREIADFTGVENVTGTFLRDQLYGDANANTLHGERGNDLLMGRGGDDTFVFVGSDSYYAGHDTIRDFSASDAEKIDLSELEQITDFIDLTTSHLSTGTGGHAQIAFTGGSILLEGWTTADIGAGLAISEDDFIF